ncbi:flavin reductase family protein [uncultured Arthrobacter sp.]|uniref:flavin reductase family protein n=1 Tax=uncultured Arthrobacter sp. TaxID=114050 RepID=UPI0026357122|nr:flavin reductase family protein [uncultured Arthrobacter sp.]
MTTSAVPQARPGVVDQRTFRDVVGHFGTGVTVITALGAEGPLGFTCQSFSSLSLDPPLVTFSPARTSSSWPRIRRVGRFTINILSAGNEVLSTTFARSGVDRFAGVEWTVSPNGSPRLPGILASLDCDLQAEHDGGDHTIVVASVQGLGIHRSGDPLLFYRGRYLHLEPDLAT